MFSINKKTFVSNLHRWYGRHARDLPWRHTTDPYKIWISEIMLQQTTVKTVIPYYQKWVKRFPCVRSVAVASLQEVLKAWQGLGYYQRAKNIHKAAKIIHANYEGKLPVDPLELRKLPGFGPYTMGAVLSIAFRKRYPIIDANVRKVFMRLFAFQGSAVSGQDKKILPLLEKLLPQRNIHIFNQALMELGALVCRHKEPLCLQCPVKHSCLAYQKGIQEIIPEPKKKELKNITAVVGLIRKKKKIFIQKRPSHGLLADLWEFPGGKVKKGEGLLQALTREIKEELDVKVIEARPLISLRHYYTQYRVHLHVMLCRLDTDPLPDQTHQWIGFSQISSIPMPSGNAKIIEKLRKNQFFA